MTAQVQDGVEVQERERAFWNQAAAEAKQSLDAATYRVTREDLCDPAMPWLAFMGMTKLVQQLLDSLGDLRGKRVLDIGAGTGFLSVALALRGAHVTSTDIAEEALSIARFRAEVSGVAEHIDFVAVASEDLFFPEGSFDAVVGIFVLHHLDLALALPAVRRALKPGGKAAFIETMARNRLLMFFRRHLTGRFGVEKASSDDEAPLDARAEARLREAFGQVDFHYPELVFLRMAVANIPLFQAKSLMWLLRRLDLALWHIPWLRSLGYFSTVVLDVAPGPPGKA